MRQLYFIKEKNTATWCYSSKHRSFCDEFDVAAIFLQKENAEKAIKEMTRGIDPNKTTWPYWMADGKSYTAVPDRACDAGVANGAVEIILLVPEFEVVAFTLNEDILV